MDASSKRNGKKILRSLGLAVIIALSVSYYLRTRAPGERAIYSQDTISLQYLWLGDDRLLINTYKQGASNTTWSSETSIVHPGGNIITPARDMSATAGFGPSRWKLSPNGRQVLFGDAFGNISVCNTSYILGDTNGLPVTALSVDMGSIRHGGIAWCDNSEDWIWILCDDTQPIYILSSKGHRKKLKIKNSAQYSTLLPNLCALGYIGKTTALLFAFDDNQNPGDFKIHILTMDVSTGVIGSDRIVPVPANVDTSNLGIDPFNVSFNAVLSPDKKQIAYIIPSTPKPMFPHSRAFASVRNNLTRWHVLQPPPDTAIWISDIDGNHMRVINQWSQGTDIDYDLEWRPDSKALSWMRMKGTQPTSTPRTSTQSISIQGTMQIGTLQGGATQVSIQGDASHNIYSIQMLPL